MVRQPPPALGLGDHVCLALVAEGIDHGWAIGSELAPDGALGRIWSLSRPLTYRAIDNLVGQRLLTRSGTAQGRGRDRSIVRITAAGRSALGAWLDEPVAHLRDVRTELLVKLALRVRAGLRVEPLLVAQRATFAPTIDVLTTTSDADDVDEVDDVVVRWRREHARAVRRFLDESLHPERAATRTAVPTKLRLSARNQLNATVTDVTHGDVMSTVRVELPDGQPLTAAITKDAVADLDIATGDAVLVIVKSTEVMLGKS